MEHTWKELYLNDVKKFPTIDAYFNEKIQLKKTFINLIKSFAGLSKKPILEAGCGTAVISDLLAKDGYDIYSIDNNHEILELAFNIAENILKNNKPKFQCMDIKNIKYSNSFYSVSFSNGVLEHFSDEDIIRIINEQTRVADIMIFGIPTKYFSIKTRYYGDERYLSNRQWRQLIFDANCRILKECSFNYEPLKKRICNWKKWFKPKAFHVFAIKKN